MRKTTGPDLLAVMSAARAEGFTRYPIWREVLADCETPVSAYRKLASSPYTFLLESVEGGERLARYSFIGIAPEAVLIVHGNTAEWQYLRGKQAGERRAVPCPDPLALIAGALDAVRVAPVPPPGSPGATLPRFTGGAVGYLGYENVARFERVPLPEQDPLGVPDAVLIFTETLLIFDHVTHRALLLVHADLSPEADLAMSLAVAQEQLEEIALALAETPLAHTALLVQEPPGPRARRNPTRAKSDASWQACARRKRRSSPVTPSRSCSRGAVPAPSRRSLSPSIARCGR